MSSPPLFWSADRWLPSSSYFVDPGLAAYRCQSIFRDVFAVWHGGDPFRLRVKENCMAPLPPPGADPSCPLQNLYHFIPPDVHRPLLRCAYIILLGSGVKYGLQIITGRTGSKTFNLEPFARIGANCCAGSYLRARVARCRNRTLLAKFIKRADSGVLYSSGAVITGARSPRCFYRMRKRAEGVWRERLAGRGRREGSR